MMKRMCGEPKLKNSRYTKDFSWGFYCTNNFEQAKKWARRNREHATVNLYTYRENKNLKILKFENMTDEWLEYPTHQISFHTLKALDCLKFERSEIVNE